MRLLKLPEMAEQLGVGHTTIRWWMKNRVIPYLQVRQCILFDEVKVMRALSKYERAAVKPVAETIEEVREA